MSLSASNHSEMKAALKEVLVELFHERRDLFYDLFKEIIEENRIAETPLPKEAAVASSDIPRINADAIPQEDDFETAVSNEIAAFHRLHPSLLKKHHDEFVAIHRQQLVDHDADKIALHKRIKEKYSEQFVLIRLVEEEPERELHLRSPRFSVKAP